MHSTRLSTGASSTSQQHLPRQTAPQSYLGKNRPYKRIIKCSCLGNNCGYPQSLDTGRFNDGRKQVGNQEKSSQLLHLRTVMALNPDNLHTKPEIKISAWFPF
jgi:hypothetical protein